MSSVFLLMDKLKVLFGIRGIWPLFPSHRTKCLLQFEATEDDSALQLLWARNQLENSEQKGSPPKKKRNASIPFLKSTFLSGIF